MLLEAVVEVAGDFTGGGIGGEGVDVWINLGAETETEVATCALGMGWVVNRCLWVVEKNAVHEAEEEEEKKKGGTVVVQSKEKKGEEKGPQQQVQQQQQQQQQSAKQDYAPAVHVHAHAAPGTPVGVAQTSTSHVHVHAQGKQGKHWSFGDLGKGMKGWRERWVKTLDISHGHGKA